MLLLARCRQPSWYSNELVVYVRVQAISDLLRQRDTVEYKALTTCCTFVKQLSVERAMQALVATYTCSFV